MSSDRAIAAALQTTSPAEVERNFATTESLDERTVARGDISRATAWP